MITSQDSLSSAIGPVLALTGTPTRPRGLLDRIGHFALIGDRERSTRSDSEEMVCGVLGAVPIGDVRVGAGEMERHLGVGA